MTGLLVFHKYFYLRLFSWSIASNSSLLKSQNLKIKIKKKIQWLKDPRLDLSPRKEMASK